MMHVVRREWLWILIVVVVDLVASGCGRSKPAETGDASGGTAPPADGQPHGCIRMSDKVRYDQIIG